MAGIQNGVVKTGHVRTALIAFSVILITAPSQAGDHGQYRHISHDITTWIENLTDAKGVPCCSGADGMVPSAWVIGPRHYRVKIQGAWLDVPDRAVIKAPNRLGHPVVWIGDDGEAVTVRCFLPGPLS